MCVDRFARILRHLAFRLDEMTAIGGGFVSLGEAIDTSPPTGRLRLHILGAIAEVERARIAERVKAEIRRAKAQGTRLGRPRLDVSYRTNCSRPARGLSVRLAAAKLGVSTATTHRWLKTETAH